MRRKRGLETPDGAGFDPVESIIYLGDSVVIYLPEHKAGFTLFIYRFLLATAGN